MHKAAVFVVRLCGRTVERLWATNPAQCQVDVTAYAPLSPKLLNQQNSVKINEIKFQMSTSSFLLLFNIVYVRPEFVLLNGSIIDAFIDRYISVYTRETDRY